MKYKDQNKKKQICLLSLRTTCRKNKTLKMNQNFFKTEIEDNQMIKKVKAIMNQRNVNKNCLPLTRKIENFKQIIKKVYRKWKI